MQVTFLGTASGLPSMKRCSSSLLVSNHDEFGNTHKFLLDAGDGVSAQIVRFMGVPKPDLDDIEGVVITHTHSDHFTGIFLFIQMLHVLQRENALTIYITVDAIDTFNQMLELTFMYDGKRGYDLNIIALEQGKSFELAGFDITPYPTTHYDGYIKDSKLHKLKQLLPFSIRVVHAGKSFVFSGDIGELEDLTKPLSKNITDVLIVEGMHYEMGDLPKYLDKFTLGAVYLTHLMSEPEDFRVPPGIHIAREFHTIKF